MISIGLSMIFPMDSRKIIFENFNVYNISGDALKIVWWCDGVYGVLLPSYSVGCFSFHICAGCVFKIVCLVCRVSCAKMHPERKSIYAFRPSPFSDFRVYILLILLFLAESLFCVWCFWIIFPLFRSFCDSYYILPISLTLWMHCEESLTLPSAWHLLLLLRRKAPLLNICIYKFFVSVSVNVCLAAIAFLRLARGVLSCPYVLVIQLIYCEGGIVQCAIYKYHISHNRWPGNVHRLCHSHQQKHIGSAPFRKIYVLFIDPCGRHITKRGFWYTYI